MVKVEAASSKVRVHFQRGLLRRPGSEGHPQERVAGGSAERRQLPRGPAQAPQTPPPEGELNTLTHLYSQILTSNKPTMRISERTRNRSFWYAPNVFQVQI